MANMHNPRGKTSKFKGVSFSTRDKIWISGIRINRKSVHIGSFVDEKDAARAYDTVAGEQFGEFAKLNFP